MKSSTLKIFTAVILFVLILPLVSQAASWRTCNGKNQHWRNDKTTMSLSTTSFPIGSTFERQTQYMMSEWNRVGGSNFKFYVGRDTDGTHNTNNGTNEVYFENRPDETYLGVTRTRYTCYWLFGTRYGYNEADIGMNTRYAWTSSDFTGSTGGSPYNFELVMLHELGHALGLNHSDGRPATMNTFYYNGGPVGHYNNVELHGDDRHGLRILYPDGSSDRDISASRFQNSGGGSSRINRVRTTHGGITSSLNRGSQYDVEYMLENLGTDTESVKVNFYLSTNSYISSADTYIGSTTWSIPPGSNATAKKRFVVPSTLPAATYYIGFKVDADSTIPESREQNNFVSLLTPVSVN